MTSPQSMNGTSQRTCPQISQSSGKTLHASAIAARLESRIVCCCVCALGFQTLRRCCCRRCRSLRPESEDPGRRAAALVPAAGTCEGQLKSSTGPAKRARLQRWNEPILVWGTCSGKQWGPEPGHAADAHVVGHPSQCSNRCQPLCLCRLCLC